MIDRKTYSFTTQNGISMQADLYQASGNKKHTTIVYLHGGGLLYGVRDDLPLKYIEMFVQAGYDLLAIDYPLAPECNLDEIMQATLQEVVFYLKDNCAALGMSNQKYILFGRSAGAYLAFMLYKLLANIGWHKPQALISLYGYCNFGEAQFRQPSRHYSKLAIVSSAQVDKIISDQPVVYGLLHERFALYIKARQDGNWLEYLGVDVNNIQYSLSAEQLQSLPPLIMAAATLDPDVPYRASKNLSKIVPDAKLITVYEQEHDFDRDTTKPIGKQVYQEIIEWLGDKK